MRLTVDHLPGDRDPKPVWLWWSRARRERAGRRGGRAGLAGLHGVGLFRCRAGALAGRGIDPLRGTGRLVGTGVVNVDGVRRTAEHIVVATGSDPIVPAIPGLGELEGVWGTRDATSMTVVPRRLLVLGGGSAGVELAQVVRRLGGEAVLIEGAGRVLPREPAPLGEALGEALRRDGIELMLGMHATAARREGEYVLQFGDATEVRGDRLPG